MALNWRTYLAPGSDRRLVTHGPRWVRVVGDIDETLMDTCSRQFTRIVASGQPYVPVVVHSQGGNLCDALAFMALLSTSPVPVVTICTGQAYSAGALVFSAGTEGYRFVAPDATLMLHQVSLAGIAGTAREVTNEARELERVNASAFLRLAANTGQPAAYFSHLVKHADGDVYLNAPDAVHHRLANHVGVPHVEVRVTATMHVTARPWTVAARDRTWTVVPPVVGPGGGGGVRRSRKRPRGGGRRDASDDDDGSDSGGSDGSDGESD